MFMMNGVTAIHQLLIAVDDNVVCVCSVCSLSCVSCVALSVYVSQCLTRHVHIPANTPMIRPPLWALSRSLGLFSRLCMYDTNATPTDNVHVDTFCMYAHSCT